MSDEEQKAYWKAVLQYVEFFAEKGRLLAWHTTITPDSEKYAAIREAVNGREGESFYVVAILPKKPKVEGDE